MQFPRWAWYIIAVAIVLMVLAVMKVDLRIGRSGISITQDLVH